MGFTGPRNKISEWPLRNTGKISRKINNSFIDNEFCCVSSLPFFFAGYTIKIEIFSGKRMERERLLLGHLLLVLPSVKAAERSFPMKTNLVICIGRQFGSGGRVVGEKLAERLEIPCYDKLLVKKAAMNSGILEEFFERADEQPVNRFWPSFWLSPQDAAFNPLFYSDYLTNDRLFQLQSETIQKIAAEGPCVMIGRCAEYVLREHKHKVSIFLHAEKSFRVERIMAIHQTDAKRAEQMLIRADKNRANYHDFYADNKWGACGSYDLSVSTSFLGVEKTVDLLERYCTEARSSGNVSKIE